MITKSKKIKKYISSKKSIFFKKNKTFKKNTYNFLNNVFDFKKTKKKKSYAPSINKLKSLKSIDNTSIQNLLNCKNKTIKIKKKCYKWNSNKVKKMLIKNLLNKKRNSKNINTDIIIAPKQYKSNCWFNVFFMIFFVSDRGRKFYRFFRKAMIEGKIYVKSQNNKFIKKNISKNLKYPFFLLNYYIEMSLQGKITNIDKKFNTNNIIKKIYNTIKKNKKNINNFLNNNIYNVNDAGNPLSYYNSIFNYLLEDNYINPINSVTFTNPNINNINFIFEKNNIYGNLKHYPKIIFIQYYNHSNLLKKTHFKIHNIKYKLDSIVLRSTNNEHFSSYITCNKKDFGFDGGANKPLQKFEWKKKINENNDFNFKGLPNKIKFNFNNGYCIYLYYRIN